MDRRISGPTYRAEDVRQGEIVLKKPWQRWVFFAGLAGMVLLALIGKFGFGLW